MHSKQGWREETEDGEIREVRVNRVAGSWRFQSRMKGETEWTRHDPPLLQDVRHLHEMMDRKYHRRRTSLKVVEELRKMLTNLEVATPKKAPGKEDTDGTGDPA